MANGVTDPPLVKHEEGATITDWSISKLISSLRSTSRPDYYAKVTSILVARQEKSNMEIQSLKQQTDSFLLKTEQELKNCRKGFQEMKNDLSKLREENMVLRAREKSAQERCEKLLEDVKRNGEKDHELIDLRSNNCELECAKSKAEAEMEIMKKRFGELDKRVLNLESDLTFLKDQKDNSNGNGIGVENGHSENGTVKADETMKVDDVFVGPSCDSPVKANGHSNLEDLKGSGKLPSQNIVEIVEIDSSDDDCAEAENLSEKRSHSAENSHSDKICLQNGAPSLKRKRSFESVNGDNDDNTLNGKLKMKKVQEPVCKPDDCSLKHCSKTTISSDNNEVIKNVATPRADIMASRLHEQKTVSELESRNLTNGFPLDGLGFLDESSCSSDSDSESDDEGPVIFPGSSQLAPETQRKIYCSSVSDGPVIFSTGSKPASETQRKNRN